MVGLVEPVLHDYLTLRVKTSVAAERFTHLLIRCSVSSLFFGHQSTLFDVRGINVREMLLY